MNFIAHFNSAGKQSMPLWRGALIVFILLTGVYSFSIDIRASWGASITGDEPFYLVTTQSLIMDGDLDLANQFEKSTYASFFDHSDGLWYQSNPIENEPHLSPHNPGLPVLLIPGFLLGGLLGSQVQMMLMAAATFALAFVLVGNLTGQRWTSLLVTLGVGTTAPSFIYSTEIYPEMPAALVLILGLLMINTTRPIGIRRSLLLVLLISILPWLGVKYSILSLVLGAAVIYKSSASSRLIFVTTAIASGILYGVFHMHTYGGLTPYNVNIVYAGQHTIAIVDQHFQFTDRIYRLWGLFIDQRFGLGRWAPILMFGSILLPSILRRNLICWLVGILCGSQLIIGTFIAITMMGWWFPGRTLQTCVPLLIIPIVYAWCNSGVRYRVVAILLIIYSSIVTISLGMAGHAREIAVAVNPFELSASIFTIPEILFPNYTGWGLHTWITTLGWLALILTSASLYFIRLNQPIHNTGPSLLKGRPNNSSDTIVK